MTQSFESFIINANIKTTVYMSVEDVGEDIPVGTNGYVISEPSDEEELVGVTINGYMHYLPQDVLEVVAGEGIVTPAPHSTNNN